MTKQDQQWRNILINRFANLHVGDLEKIDTIDIADLYLMVLDLEQAQALGKLNLDTDQGIENLKLIVSQYV